MRSQEIEHFEFSTALANDVPVSEAEHVSGTVTDEVKPTNKKDIRTDGKLVISEEIAKGHITWESMKLYLSGLAGNYPLIFYSFWISALLLTHMSDNFQVWFLGYWGSEYETHIPSEVNAVS